MAERIIVNLSSTSSDLLSKVRRMVLRVVEGALVSFIYNICI